MTIGTDQAGLPAGAVARATQVLQTQEGVLELSGSLALHFGGELNNVRVAWRIAGAVNGPVVAALGGISAGRRVFSDSLKQSTSEGWWSPLVGPDRALDSNAFRILGFDYLGGSGDSTGPRAGDSTFPSISAYDQAEILRRLIAHLGIDRLHAIVGASYGGMVALAFAERFPALVRRIVVISAADRSHPMATAWRSVQRAMVRYAAERGEGAEGLRLARALAMATYRTPVEFAQRFNGQPEQLAHGFRFPVEGYLFARGDAYAQSYVPEAFVRLSESIDLHRVDAAAIRVPATLVAVREDQLVPLADMAALRDRLGGPAELVEISSLYGHDAFLKEETRLRPVFASALQG